MLKDWAPNWAQLCPRKHWASWPALWSTHSTSFLPCWDQRRHSFGKNCANPRVAGWNFPVQGRVLQAPNPGIQQDRASFTPQQHPAIGCCSSRQGVLMDIKKQNSVQRITESLRLEKTSRITKSNSRPSSPCPLPTSLNATTPWFLNTSRDSDSTTPWAACESAWPLFRRRNVS